MIIAELKRQYFSNKSLQPSEATQLTNQPVSVPLITHVCMYVGYKETMVIPVVSHRQYKIWNAYNMSFFFIGYFTVVWLTAASLPSFIRSDCFTDHFGSFTSEEH